MRLHKYAFQAGGPEPADCPDEPTEHYGRQEWLEEIAGEDEIADKHLSVSARCGSGK